MFRDTEVWEFVERGVWSVGQCFGRSGYEDETHAPMLWFDDSDDLTWVSFATGKAYT